MQPAKFRSRQLHLQIWSQSWAFLCLPLPPVLSWFCSPSDSCTYTWVTTCGYPRKELQHLTFGLSCISSLLAEGQFLDSRQKYVWVLKELEDWWNTSSNRTRCSVSNLFISSKESITNVCLAFYGLSSLKGSFERFCWIVSICVRR